MSFQFAFSIRMTKTVWTCAASRTLRMGSKSVPQCGGVDVLQPRQRVLAIDDDLLAAALGRVEHHVGEDLFEDAAQRARPELLLDRILDDRPERALVQVELDAVERERL